MIKAIIEIDEENSKGEIHIVVPKGISGIKDLGLALLQVHNFETKLMNAYNKMLEKGGFQQEVSSK
jgi:hypothetical protein